MPDYRRYDDMQVGDLYPAEPLSFEVSASVVDGFMAATGNDAPYYAERDGLRRAPSMIASVYLIELLRARRSPPGGIHAKQAIRFHRPVNVGETLTIQARVTEKYRRKERPYMVSEFEAVGSDGSLVASGRVTSIWGREE